VRVVLADHGAGNLRSVASALARAGAEPVVSADPVGVREAPLVVIAGVGNAASAAAGLAPVAGALRDRVAAGRPVLGICVGLQLLFEESDEGGSGLGLLRGRVRRLRARTVPHMGWNGLAATRATSLLHGLDGCTGSRELADGRAELQDLRLQRRAARWGLPDLAPAGAPLATSLQPWTEDVTLAAWLGGWAGR